MTIVLPRKHLDNLFPAYIAVDPALRITSLGKSIRRLAPWVKVGDPLLDHFRAATPMAYGEMGELVASGGQLSLTSLQGGLVLSGRVAEQEDGYFLALAHTTSIESPDIDHVIGDFAPGDPQLSSLLLIGLQKGLIEDSRRVASELAAERERVVEIMERAGRMAGYVAHDFNNYLSIITLNAKRLLRGSELDPRQAHCADVVLETAERCSELTRAMMTLANRKSDSRLPFAIDSALADSVALFRSACGSNITLHFRPGAGDRDVDAARNGLVNCLVNLLVNARQAMAEGGSITLSTALAAPYELRADCVRSGQRYLVVTVADEGSGMPPDVLDRAFDMFFSTKPDGSGMGLASARDFAQQMGGWITLNSYPGAGTTVRLYLPEAQRAVIAPAPSQALETLSGRRSVLVVDDEPYALEALAEILDDEGYEVRTATSAALALEELAAAPCDVLVTDVIMHGDDGITLAREATRTRPDLAVILMSGFVPDAAELAPDWLFLRKPIDPGLLCQMIASTGIAP